MAARGCESGGEWPDAVHTYLASLDGEGEKEGMASWACNIRGLCKARQLAHTDGFSHKRELEVTATGLPNLRRRPHQPARQAGQPELPSPLIISHLHEQQPWRAWQAWPRLASRESQRGSIIDRLGTRGESQKWERKRGT